MRNQYSLSVGFVCKKFKPDMSDYILEDTLLLIFKYLPVESLLRFRSVCKEWKQLLDSPSLVQDHLSVQTPRFIVEYARKYTVVDPRPRPLVHTISKPTEKKDFVLVGTLHGVVCLYEKYQDMVLWNPSIRKFSSLPSGFEWKYTDQAHSSYGFWIHPLSKEFKIVMLQPRQDMISYGNLLNCHLYSSIRRDWSVVPTTGNLGNWKSCKQGPPVMIGGVAHWGGYLDESRDGFHRPHEQKNKAILSFDFVQESFDVIRVPDDLVYYKIAPCRWQGVLSLVCWKEKLAPKIKVYLRQEDSWAKMCSFRVGEPVVHVFWAMEDMYERTKAGKRRREMDERLSADLGETTQGVRILATIITEYDTDKGALLLEGTKSGSKYVRRTLADYDRVNIGYDFVQSLLFP